MPYKDPEMKKRYMKHYRAESIYNGYGKWLYQRRALRYADADHYRETLIAIARGSEDAAALAHEALQASADRWESIGPPPDTKQTKKRPQYPDEELLGVLSELEQ